MTYKIENFTRGAFKSSFNALIEKIKTTSYNDSRANNIDRFLA